MMDEGPVLTARGSPRPVCFSHIESPPPRTSLFRPIKQGRAPGETKRTWRSSGEQGRRAPARAVTTPQAAPAESARGPTIEPRGEGRREER